MEFTVDETLFKTLFNGKLGSPPTCDSLAIAIECVMATTAHTYTQLDKNCKQMGDEKCSHTANRNESHEESRIK